MDPNIISFIQTIGFPAVCVVGMAWYVRYITDQNHAEIDSMNEQHRKEMSDVTQALNNNTIALQKLTDYITIGSSGKE